MRSTCRKLKSQVPTVEVKESCCQLCQLYLATQVTYKVDHRVFPCQQKCDFSYSLSTHIIYTPITHRNGKKPIERKTLRKVSTTHLPYQRELLIPREKFLQSPHSLSHCYTHREEIFTQILPTPIQSVESIFRAWEVLEDAKDGGCNIELIAGSGKLENTWLGLTLLEQKAWKAQVHRVDQAWRVFYYSCIPTLFSSGSFYRLEGSREVFC